MLIAVTLVGAFLGSALLTGVARRYSIARNVMDVPNARSSHLRPTPRGGGIGIVVSVLLSYLVFAAAGVLNWQLAWAWLGAGAFVAAVGFVDDHRPIRPLWRLAAHFAAAFWLLALMDGLPAALTDGDAGWNLVAHATTLVALVWLLNLTNFMDGIDGLAAIEIVTVCLGGVVVALAVGVDRFSTLAPAALAAATLGFLLWNWPPAKIFMGDAGSGFAGITLGAYALAAAHLDPQLLWSWVILLAVFVVDSTLTLVRRVWRGERFYEAHRSHAYQHAARNRLAHAPVTVAIGAINLLWLLPLALAVGLRYLAWPLGVAIAYAPLTLIAWHLGAGRHDSLRTTT